MTRWALLSLGLVLFALCATDPALAQSNPFGVGAGKASPPTGLAAWILQMQAMFYQQLQQTVSMSREGAAFALITVSFLYGVFHAAGPGHGKAVISSYLLADGFTYRRGIALSAAAAFVQAWSAILFVTIAALVLGLSGRAMGVGVRWLELGSYALIVAVGIWLSWRKARALADALKGEAAEPHRHGHHHHAHDHAHGPEPRELKGRGWLKRGVSAVLAVGIRPCSGAILVLVFALSQGIFLVGVLSTFVMALGTAITVAAIASLAVGAKRLARRFVRGEQRAAVAIHALELFGAVLIIALGASLMAGLLATERLPML